ncbi:hypothetical protein ACJJVG_07300 [Pseudocitrobacter faecalis]|uniref:hypothetical protein n=1 Tax=Pseudocitrobacter faecalis TaxID=1398493 RepID=UPI00389A47DD
MGCEEYPGEGGGQVEREWFVHLEVLSADARMPTFLSNPADVKGEKRTVMAPKGKMLYARQSASEQETFTATAATLGAQCVLPRETTTPAMDESQQWWFNISGSGWLPQKDVEEVGQYDLLKLGFQPLEENSSGDMTYSPYEGWVPEAFGSISRAAEQGDEWMYEQVPPYYRQLMAGMDKDGDGKVTEEEIRQVLVVRDPLVRNVVNHLTVKHHSEWYGGRSTGRWEEFYKDLDTDEVAYCEKWQTDMEWMREVSPFGGDNPLWHFHPVFFLDAIKGNYECEITVELIEKLLGHTNPWFTGTIGGRAFATHFKINYPEVFEFDKNDFVSRLNEQLIVYEITGAYHKAHFLSQCLHESAHFDTTIEFGSGHNYDPGQHSDAIKNGNTVVGDGPRYKGRGLIQLTWKKNYQRFSNHSGINCVNNPE